MLLYLQHGAVMPESVKSRVTTDAETHGRMEDIIQELRQKLRTLQTQMQLNQHELPASQNVDTQHWMVNQEPQQDKTVDISQTQEISDDTNSLSTWEVL